MARRAALVYGTVSLSGLSFASCPQSLSLYRAFYGLNAATILPEEQRLLPAGGALKTDTLLR